MTMTADVVNAAMSKFGASYPRGHEARQSLLEGLSRDAFDEFNDKFYALLESENGGFEAAANGYAARLST